MLIYNLHIKEQCYGSKIVLQDILQLYESGKIHGFLGENGAGKTTLFHCMANLVPFRGERMIQKTVRFGYLPAELFMYPMITGNEFLQFYITAKGVRYKCSETYQLNKLFELPLDEYAETYSTGMLKKLYLLGLLLQKNEILLLDEPFNGLDFKSSAFITELIVNFKKQEHTVFVASHDMEHLFSYADTISVIHDKHLTFYSQPSSFEQIKANIISEAQHKVQECAIFK